MERSQYLQRCFNNHLQQTHTYDQLSEPESKTHRYNARAHIMLAVAEYTPDKLKRRQPPDHPLLTKAEVNYFQTSFVAEPIR
jgi:hypothetical protein